MKIVIYKLLLNIYNFLFYIIVLISMVILPFAKNRQKIKERLLLAKKTISNKKYIWIHGASVGEVLSAKTLINHLLVKYKDEFQIIITSHTETSKNIIETTFSNSVEHHYLPYDCGFLASKFIKNYNPSLVLWLEQDFFPIILSKISNKKIPLLLLNARISDSSFKKWKKIHFIIFNILSYFNDIYPMSTYIADKINFLNGKDNKFIGNLKYSNVEITKEVFEEEKKIISYFDNYLILTILSFHFGEEEIIINLYNYLKKNGVNVKIIAIPRHINKKKQILANFKEHDIKTTLYSEIHKLSSIEDIILLDAMGKTNIICSFSDLAFIGKSLYIKGGHNLLEPLSVGCPVVFGKNMGNFKDIVDDTLNNKAGLEVNSEQELAEKVLYLFKNKAILIELKNNTSFVQKQGQNIIKNLEGAIDCYLRDCHLKI